MPRAGAAAELELYPVHVKLLRYQLTGQRQPNANMFAGMVGSIGGFMSSKQTNVVIVVVVVILSSSSFRCLIICSVMLYC